jgi:hypothetical protein
VKWIGFAVIVFLIVLVVGARGGSSDGPDMSRIFAPPGLYEVAPDGTYIPVQRDPGGTR